ncbi:MAG: magnesium transporter [Saprospiraceae bacterium]|nr:magnesium transporter [Saprospiraceae bacterium]
METATETTLKKLERLLQLETSEELISFIDGLNSHEIVYIMSHLNREDQTQLLTRLTPENAASLMEELPEQQAAEIVEDMRAADAAAILNEMPSDEQTDILWELESEEAEAILSLMDPEEAADVRRLIDFDPDTAGGLMVTEFLSFRENQSVRQIVADLKRQKEAYARLHIKYIYINKANGEFAGVLQIQDLLLADPETRLSEIIIPDVITVPIDFHLERLVDFFHTHDFYGVPVIDQEEKMLGVVLRKDVLEAWADQTSFDHLESQGIVGGEELRTMPLFARAKNRLSWLSINIILNLIAASVIAFHQDTLSSVIALAVFLPIISDMSGCSGNQAVAVSMRELSIGAVKSGEAFRVWMQEIGIGLVNGLSLGFLIGLAAFLWKGSMMLGLVVGGALAINTIVAVSLGGTVPLLLKHRGVDPALASGPILTTITDMAGFFLALTFASLSMAHLAHL